MKIKYCIPALLLAFVCALFIPSNNVFAFESVSEVLPSKTFTSNMNSSYSNNEFHIPPHSDDSTNLIYYYPIDNKNFGYEGGRVYLHSDAIPYLQLNQSSSSKLSFVYTYELSIIVAGQEYPLSANFKTEDSTSVLPTWQSAAIYDWNGTIALKYNVRLTYTNMDAESVIAKFNWVVPQMNFQIHPLGYHGTLYYLKNIADKITTGLTEISNKISSNFQKLFNENDAHQEELVNGYDDTEGTESNALLNETLDTYQENEQVITEQAFEGIEEYTVTEEGAQSFAVQFLTVFPLVASMMQSFYQSASSFNIVISVMFTTIIASMVIGLFRFYRS